MVASINYVPAEAKAIAVKGAWALVLSQSKLCVCIMLAVLTALQEAQLACAVSCHGLHSCLSLVKATQQAQPA